jgi:aspartate dehydrogenase
VLDVGLIGAGAIGARVARALSDGAVPGARVASLYTRTDRRARDVVTALDADREIRVASGPAQVGSRSDVVVEAASQSALEESATDVLATGADLVALSVGAFRDADFLSEVRSVAEENHARVHVPSGSIGCLDAVAALGNAPLDAVELRCYRPSKYFGPYVDEGVALDDLEDGAVIFDGTAAEAAAAFPAHMNVAVAVALAARVDPGDVAVHIEVDSSAPRARYVVSARGAGGSLEAEILNVRTHSSPETGRINVLSVVETLRRLSDPVVVGT